MKKENKEDKLIRSLINKAGKEMPSDDFTAKLMKKIEVSPAPVVYQPVISTRTWIIIGLAIASLFGYIGFSSSLEQSTPYFEDLNKINNFSEWIINIFNFGIQFDLSPAIFWSILGVFLLWTINYLLRDIIASKFSS